MRKTSFRTLKAVHQRSVYSVRLQSGLHLLLQAPAFEYIHRKVETLVPSTMIDTKSSQSNYRDTFFSIYLVTSIITILEPIAYTADEFGVSIGPVVYSNVDCGGWENYLIECQKNNYLEITCSYATVAGVLCADGQCQYLSVKKYDIHIIL